MFKFNKEIYKLWALVAFIVSLCTYAVETRATELSQGWYSVSADIAEASYKTGVDVKLLTAMAEIESSFRPWVKNSNSSARGLFQFTERTWRVTIESYGAQFGIDYKTADIHDSLTNAIIGAEYIKENIGVLQNQIGRAPTYSEIYLAHLVSPLRAGEIIKLRNNTILANLYPNIASVNKNLFYKDDRPVTALEFKQILKKKIAQSLHVYGELAEYALVAYKDETIQIAKLNKLFINYKSEKCEIPPNEIMAIMYVGTDTDEYSQLLDTSFEPSETLPPADRRLHYNTEQCADYNQY